jgi:hypothetical protein
MQLHWVRHAAVLATLALTAACFGHSAVAAEPAAQPVPQDSTQTSEVEVIASKLDEHTLKRVAMKFVESHAAVSPAIHQMSRWKAKLCPSVTGLTPAADAYVTGRVEEIARHVGARTRGVDQKCQANVEIVFTSEPQKLLDHMAKDFPVLLGSSRSAGDTSISRAIQPWYLTGTTSTAGFQPPTPDPNTPGDNAALLLSSSDPQSKSSVSKVDPDYGSGNQPSGVTGSYFTKGLTSELQHVFVIVDRGKVATLSVRAIADYVAMLSLTHMASLDTCSEFPSIIDLLSSGCGGEREKPASLTDADTAYLKALYSSNRETNLNLEQGDMRDQMIQTILGK